MINVVKVLSTELDSLKRMVTKFLRLGKDDVQTSIVVGPHGLTSNPYESMVAIYANTQIGGKNYIIGYINKHEILKVGETRIFATNSTGEEQGYLHFESNGDIEFSGNGNFMVRYNQLETAFNELKGKFDSHTHPFINAIGIPSTTSPTNTPSTADITGCKITKFKTE